MVSIECYLQLRSIAESLIGMMLDHRLGPKGFDVHSCDHKIAACKASRPTSSAYHCELISTIAWRLLSRHKHLVTLRQSAALPEAEAGTHQDSA